MMSASYYIIDSLLLLSIYCQYVLLINKEQSTFDITFTVLAVRRNTMLFYIYMVVIFITLDGLYFWYNLAKYSFQRLMQAAFG